MDLCDLKNLELEPQVEKYTGRVVLRGDIVKDDSGSYAVFTTQGSSASQLRDAKVMDVIARLPGCDGQAVDAVSAYTQVKMENDPKLRILPKSERPDFSMPLPRHKWPPLSPPHPLLLGPTLRSPGPPLFGDAPSGSNPVSLNESVVLDETWLRGFLCPFGGFFPTLSPGGFFFDPRLKETIEDARKKLETPMAPAMPCQRSKKCNHGETRGKTNEIISKLACILEASESTRLRMEESLPNYHEDHIAGKEDNSLQHHNFGTQNIAMPQDMKIPAAKAAVDKEWKKLEKIPAWDLTKVRSKKEVIDEARTKGAKVHFASLMDLCHLKNWELEPQF